MFKKVKEFIVELCKSAVTDVMEFSGMNTNDLDDLSTFSRRGFTIFSILMSIGMLTLFAGWTVITWIILVYNILNWATICVGVYYLTNEVYDEFDEKMEELYKEFDEIKKEISEEKF